MQYSIKKNAGSEVVLTVTFEHEEIAKKLETAAAKVSEHVEIKGFRKGFAPLDKVIAQAGEMVVYEHAAEMLVKNSYPDILTKEHIEPLTQPQIKFEKLAPQNEFVYTATFIQIPTVTVGDLKSISVKDAHVEVTQQEVDKVIQELREYSATEALVDREAKMGDIADVNFVGYKDGVAFEGGSASNYKLPLGKKQMIPGFEEGVVGMKKGETKELALTFPQDYHNASFAGVKVTFTVTVNDVFERVLPEVNDSFALLHGKKTLEELTNQIRHNLEHEHIHKQNQRVELEIIEQLIKKSTFGDIPQVLVNQEIEKMLQELSMNVMQQGLQFSEYLTHIKKTEAELRLDFAVQATERVKAALLTRAIYIQNNMNVSDEELATEIKMYKEMYKDNPSMASRLDNKQEQEMIRNMMSNNKVMNFIKTEAGIKTIEHKH
ncbi:trigger factor [Candidatus Falkowbacteria bacterium]|nr:trigger factor [Candidatus Falkowbacteria bacterium]